MTYDFVEEELRMHAAFGLLKLKNRRTSEGKKTPYQNLVLRRVYSIIKYPSKQTQRDLAILLNLGERSIKLWFQNERQTEDKETLKEGFVGFEISPLILHRISQEVLKITRN